MKLHAHTDWRVPDAKELQTTFDYSRSSATKGTAAIDPLFSCIPITAENGASDFPFYGTSTTHATWNGSAGRGVDLSEGSWERVAGQNGVPGQTN